MRENMKLILVLIFIINISDICRSKYVDNKGTVANIRRNVHDIGGLSKRNKDSWALSVQSRDVFDAVEAAVPEDRRKVELKDATLSPQIALAKDSPDIPATTAKKLGDNKTDDVQLTHKSDDEKEGENRRQKELLSGGMSVKMAQGNSDAKEVMTGNDAGEANSEVEIARRLETESGHVAGKSVNVVGDESSNDQDLKGESDEDKFIRMQQIGGIQGSHYNGDNDEEELDMGQMSNRDQKSDRRRIKLTRRKNAKHKNHRMQYRKPISHLNNNDGDDQYSDDATAEYSENSEFFVEDTPKHRKRPKYRVKHRYDAMRNPVAYDGNNAADKIGRDRFDTDDNDIEIEHCSRCHGRKHKKHTIGIHNREYPMIMANPHIRNRLIEYMDNNNEFDERLANSQIGHQLRKLQVKRTVPDLTARDTSPEEYRNVAQNDKVQNTYFVRQAFINYVTSRPHSSRKYLSLVRELPRSLKQSMDIAAEQQIRVNALKTELQTNRNTFLKLNDDQKDATLRNERVITRRRSLAASNPLHPNNNYGYGNLFETKRRSKRELAEYSISNNNILNRNLNSEIKKRSASNYINKEDRQRNTGTSNKYLHQPLEESEEDRDLDIMLREQLRNVDRHLVRKDSSDDMSVNGARGYYMKKNALRESYSPGDKIFHEKLVSDAVRATKLTKNKLKYHHAKRVDDTSFLADNQIPRRIDSSLPSDQRQEDFKEQNSTSDQLENFQKHLQYPNQKTQILMDNSKQLDAETLKTMKYLNHESDFNYGKATEDQLAAEQLDNSKEQEDETMKTIKSVDHESEFNSDRTNEDEQLHQKLQVNNQQFADTSNQLHDDSVVDGLSQNDNSHVGKLVGHGKSLQTKNTGADDSEHRDDLTDQENRGEWNSVLHNSDGINNKLLDRSHHNPRVIVDRSLEGQMLEQDDPIWKIIHNDELLILITCCGFMASIMVLMAFYCVSRHVRRQAYKPVSTSVPQSQPIYSYYSQPEY